MNRPSLLLALVVALGACVAPAHPSFPAATMPYDPADCPADVFYDQSIEATHAGEPFAFRAIVEKSGNTLTIVTLSPVGARAFTIVQQGREVDVTTQLARDLPFPPVYIALDVHRAFLLVDGAMPENGEHIWQSADAHFTDTVLDGHVMRRAIVAHEPIEQSITVEYGAPGLSRERIPPPTVTFTNATFRYVLVITTTQARPLP